MLKPVVHFGFSFATFTIVNTCSLSDNEDTIYCHQRQNADGIPGQSTVKYAIITNNTWETITITDAMLATLPNLLTLNFSYNNIRGISENAFRSLRELKTLNFTGNRLSNSFLGSSIFQNSQKLESIYLVDNSLRTIDRETFKNLTKLSVIRLSMNKITIPNPETFKEIPQLRELWLDHNIMAHIDPGLFLGVTTLEILHLEGNRLRKILAGTFVDLNFKEGKGRLFLANNSIREVENGSFSPSATLQELDIRNNPLSCEALIYRLPVSVTLHTTTFCKRPSNRTLTCDDISCDAYKRCIEDGRDARCACPAGYVGSKCQLDVNECNRNPCKETERCVDNRGSFVCRPRRATTAPPGGRLPIAFRHVATIVVVLAVWVGACILICKVKKQLFPPAPPPENPFLQYNMYQPPPPPDDYINAPPPPAEYIPEEDSPRKGTHKKKPKKEQTSPAAVHGAKKSQKSRVGGSGGKPNSQRKSRARVS